MSRARNRLIDRDAFRTMQVISDKIASGYRNQRERMVGDESPAVSISDNDLSAFETLENIKENQCDVSGSVSRIHEAGRWIFLNRETISGPPIPFLRCRFNLTNLEAIEALKVARTMQSPTPFSDL